MRLSERLVLVASFVNEGSSFADIGTGHEYIPIALTRQGKVIRAITMDVRKEPLERVREHIREYHLEERIETRLSDGAERLKAGEADTVVVAGMGGELVIHILEGSHHLWDEVGRWVLFPQSELDKVRTYLRKNGFVITKKDMVEKDGKYCAAVDVSHGIMEEMSWTGRLYGARLVRHKNPVFREFLKGGRDQLLKIREQLNAQSTGSARVRLAELIGELNRNREVQGEMQ